LDDGKVVDLTPPAAAVCEDGRESPKIVAKVEAGVVKGFIGIPIRTSNDDVYGVETFALLVDPLENLADLVDLHTSDPDHRQAIVGEQPPELLKIVLHVGVEPVDG
jgi:hypothetical protein